MALVRLNAVEIARLLSSPAGEVGLDLARRAELVQTRAKSLVGYSEVPRADSHLRDTIVKRWVAGRQNAISILIGTSHPRAMMHHEGTRPHVIVPRNASVLVFESHGETVFAAQVNHPGTKPNRFLVDALPAGL